MVASANLGILDQTNEQVLGKMEDKVQGKAENILAGYMVQLEAAQKEAAKIRDPQKRAEQLNLINTRFADVKARMVSDKTDMSNVVLAFSSYAKQLDMKIEGIFTETPEQLARRARAEKGVTDAKAEVQIAPTRNTFFNMRNPVAAAKTTLEKAESRLVEVNAEISREMNERARDANIDESLSRLQTFGERAFTVLSQGYQILLQQGAKVAADKAQSFGVAEASKQKVMELDKTITGLQTQRDSARDILAHASESDPNYVQLQRNFSDIEAKLQTANGDRMAYSNVLREESINAQEYTGYERTVNSMTSDAKALAALQQTKNRNIAKKREHFLVTMERLKNIEVTAVSIKTGNEAERRMFDSALAAGSAASNARQEVTKDQLPRLDYVHQRLDELDEQQLAAAGVDRKAREDFAKMLEHFDAPASAA